MSWATYWPYITVTTNYDNGVSVAEEFSYSHTPEQFVEELRKHDAHVYVAKGSCAECFFHPESPFPRTKLRKAEREELLPFHHILECIRNTIAHKHGRFDTPDMIVCYGYYYQHCHENKYLLAAKEADLIVFLDVSEMTSLQESGLKLTLPVFFRSDM